jgi:hypothetical protein
MKTVINAPIATVFNYSAIREQTRLVLSKLLNFERIGRVDKSMLVSRYLVSIYLAIYQHRATKVVEECLLNRLSCDLTNLRERLNILPRDLKVDIDALFAEIERMNFGISFSEIADTFEDFNPLETQ